MNDMTSGLSDIKKALVLAPHPDDSEFGCGGLLSVLKEQNTEISICVFSLCEESVPEGFPQDILKNEQIASAELIGVKPDNLHFKSYRVRRFDEKRQDILEDMVALRNSFQPDLIIMPSLFDVHQDHEVIAKQAMRAFKKCKLLSYELPWNMIQTRLNFYVSLSEKNLQDKTDMIACFKSQGIRQYSEPDFIRSLARVRGVMSGHQLAEAYTLEKWII